MKSINPQSSGRVSPNINISSNAVGGGNHPQKGNGNNANNNNANNNNNGGRISPNHNSNNRGRTSPNGRRSPNAYYERTTAVRLVVSTTGKQKGTKLNRVVRTKANVTNGVCLCNDFLEGHCANGYKCPLAHVPAQSLWDILLPRVNSETLTYEEGFSVRCYTPDMGAYYDIPCQYVFQTRGSERYIELFNDNGDNFREKFRLCPTIRETGYCAAGYDCEDVHCSVADLSGFPCIHTHVATPDMVGQYERLPAHVRVRAHQPNTGEDEGHTYTGDDVLKTVGALQYLEAYEQEGNTVPQTKMQHCAHFQNKKMCRLGDGCRFLHVVSLALSTPAQDEDPSARTSPVSNTMNMNTNLNNNSNNADGLESPINPMTPPSAAAPIGAANSGVLTPPSRARRSDAAFFALAGMTSGGGASNPSGSTGTMPLNNNSNNNNNIQQQQQQRQQQQPFIVTTGRVPVTGPGASPQLQQQQGSAAAGAGPGRRSPVRRNNPYAVSPDTFSL